MLSLPSGSPDYSDLFRCRLCQVVTLHHAISQQTHSRGRYLQASTSCCAHLLLHELVHMTLLSCGALCHAARPDQSPEPPCSSI